MRLWSLHPQYLDSKGLVALWREGLLARKVLRGETRGYRHHPQLERLKSQPAPVVAVEAYLTAVWQEARRRGYRFDGRKIRHHQFFEKIGVTSGQVDLEWSILRDKLRQRAPDWLENLRLVKRPTTNPLFIETSGDPEDWERAYVITRGKPPVRPGD